MPVEERERSASVPQPPSEPEAFVRAGPALTADATTIGTNGQPAGPPGDRATEAEKDGTGPALADATHSQEELEQYYATYSHPSVLYLRRVFQAYLAGERVDVLADPDHSAVKADTLGAGGPPSGLSAFERTYYRSKFVVVSLARAPQGGWSLLILFQDRPDRLFSAWVYGPDENLELREFWERRLRADQLQGLLSTFKRFIEDTEHAG